MTGKRFILNKGVANFSDTVTDKIYSEYNFDEIVELLNELHEENKRLKAYLVRYVSGVSYDDLDKICNDEILSEWWGDLE